MNNRYTKTAIILHWLIALRIFGMLTLGSTRTTTRHSRKQRKEP